MWTNFHSEVARTEVDLPVLCCSCSWATYTACSCPLPSSCEIWTLPIISCFAVASQGGYAPQSSRLGTSHTIIRLTTQTQTATVQEVVRGPNSATDVLAQKGCYVMEQMKCEAWSKWRNNLMSRHNKGLWWCWVVCLLAPNTLSKHTIHQLFLELKALLWHTQNDHYYYYFYYYYYFHIQ